MASDAMADDGTRIIVTLVIPEDVEAAVADAGQVKGENGDKFQAGAKEIPDASAAHARVGVSDAWRSTPDESGTWR